MTERIEQELAAIRKDLRELRGYRSIPMAVSLKGAAELLGVSARHVSRMVNRGLLRPRDVGGVQRIAMAEIETLLAGPRMESSGATPEQTRFDGAAAMARLKELRAKRKR